MKQKKPRLAEPEKEVRALIESLHESSRRLEELTAGEVDTVANRDGQTFMLRHAQDRLRHSEAAKQAAILNALPAHIALLDTHGFITSVNAAWERFPGEDAIQRPGYEIGLNYLEICDKAQGEDAADAHQVARGIRSVLEGTVSSFSIKYATHPPGGQSWFLLTVTPLAEDYRSGAVVMHLNITEQKRHAVQHKIMEEELFDEKERAQVTLNSIGDAVLCTDRSGNITYLNGVAENMTGWSYREAAGQPMGRILNILDSKTRQTIRRPLEMEAGQDRPTHLPPHCILIRRDGSELPIEESVAPIHDREGEVTGAVIVVRDVSAIRTMVLQMAHSAHHDSLTGLPNRLLMNDRITQAIALAQRHMKKVGVLFLDLDGFKHINDSLGHPTGDKVLQSIAESLAGCIRGGDTVSRQGGDEFVVLLSEMEQLEDAAIAARRMLQAVAEPHSADERNLHVTASIGVSVYPDDGLDAETLIKNADTAMYQAKENGRQSYQFFKAAMNVRAMERQFIEEELRRALERDQLTLHYQPKINLKTGAITGAEALIRWTHPTRGAVSPAQFIPVAEACGLILPISAWVLRRACLQARTWLDAGLPATTMAVNISAMEFREENFLQGLFAILGETGMDPKTLELELTESVLMKRAEAAADVLRILRAKGVRIAIDDFGTGYSSLSYLRKFSVDALKIDQSFVRQISAGGDDATIVTAIIGMARNLKLRVIAEGVETLQELNFLRKNQCDEAQGYYFSRPVVAEQFAILLGTGIPWARPGSPGPHNNECSEPGRTKAKVAPRADAVTR
jgi:diguanylate cyclase (GGDEF)-like protein/PAS domain S-box-containing protein